jgi:hypothetical protein
LQNKPFKSVDTMRGYTMRAGADGHERLIEQRELDDDDGAGGTRPVSREEEPPHQIDLSTGDTATGS